MGTDIQIAVKFQKNGTYVTFESSNKKRVDWDAISDSEYEWMIDEAISNLIEYKERYKNQEIR